MEDVIAIEMTSDQVHRQDVDGNWLGTAPELKSHGLCPKGPAEALVKRGDARFRTLEETGDESVTHPDAGDDEDDRCTATTSDGDRCSNGAPAGTDYCGIHAPDDEGEE